MKNRPASTAARTLPPEWLGLALSVNDAPLFSVRTVGVLQNAKIEFIGQLVTKTEVDLLRLPNLNRRCLREIKDFLNEDLGLRLGMGFEGVLEPDVFSNLEDLIKSNRGNAHAAYVSGALKRKKGHKPMVEKSFAVVTDEIATLASKTEILLLKPAFRRDLAALLKKHEI